MTKSVDKTEQHVSLLHELTYEAANMCVQCGYCLPVCPTYDSLSSETHSPRGRINLVKKAAEGTIDIVDDLARPIELCLGCRACEIVCPVNVPYGEIFNGALHVIAKEKKSRKNKHNIGNKTLQIMLRHVFPKKRRLRAIGSFAWFYQASRLNTVVQKTGIVDKVSPKLGQLERSMGDISIPSKQYKFGEIYPPFQRDKIKVAFFPGCVMDALMSKINKQTIDLLRKLGCEVVIPENITCCGALHAHQGNQDDAKKLAKQNIEAVLDLDVKYVVNNAGGCGAMIHEYDLLLQDEPSWYQKAQHLKEMSLDVTELLVKLGPLPFQKEGEGIVTYQDSCHLRNVQGVYEAPRKLLRSIPGIQFVELENSHLCCASGGIYNVMHFDESMEILDKKMLKVLKTKATIVVTTNPGCLLQMKLGISRSEENKNIQALHIVELLADLCKV